MKSMKTASLHFSFVSKDFAPGSRLLLRELVRIFDLGSPLVLKKSLWRLECLSSLGSGFHGEGGHT